MKKPLTSRQSEILKYLSRYILVHDHSPLWAEIAEHFGTSKRNIVQHIQSLEDRGHITRDNSTRPPVVTII